MRLAMLFLLITGISCTHIASATEDKVTLKSGDVYRGEIIHQEINQYIQIKLRDGSEKRLRWGEIQAVDKEDAVPPVTKQIAPKPNISDGWGKIKAGWIIFGVAYGATILAGAATGGGYGIIPLIGPILQVSHNKDRRYDTANYAGAALQGLGIIIGTYGYFQRARYNREMESLNRVSVAPWLDINSTGLTLSARW